MTEDRFTELLLKDLSGEILPGEKEEFQQALADDSYMKRYQLFKLYWSEHSSNQTNSENLLRKIYQKIEQAEPEVKIMNEEPMKRAFRPYRWRSIAAVLAVGVISVWLYRLYLPNIPAEKDTWLEKVTKRGQKAYFSLPDGTRISLNSSSKLRYRANAPDGGREVYLAGEAYFDVKKDREHPFVIHTEKMNVRVLGTEFNVKAYPDESTSETTLIKGAVEVTLKDRPEDKVILKPTEKLIVNFSPLKGSSAGSKEQEGRIDLPNNTLTEITYMRKQDSAIVETSWIQNKLVFKDEPLDEVCRSLERWYNVSITIKNDQLKQVRYTVTFAGEPLHAVLKALQTADPFQYRIEGDVVYIY